MSKNVTVRTLPWIMCQSPPSAGRGGAGRLLRAALGGPPIRGPSPRSRAARARVTVAPEPRRKIKKSYRVCSESTGRFGWVSLDRKHKLEMLQKKDNGCIIVISKPDGLACQQLAKAFLLVPMTMCPGQKRRNCTDIPIQVRHCFTDTSMRTRVTVVQ